MNENNENIVCYIKDNYIKSKIDPKFAVLVKGDWGCGKTFLVHNILKEIYGKDWEKNVVWISVYGLSTIQQLQQKIFEKLHPNLTGNAAKFAFDVMNTVTQTVNINLTDALTSFLDIIQDKDKKNEMKLLILDDIERCSIPISELFGFVSEEIIEKNLKVIFIANDKKLENENDYKSIKEKIIGMEFEVQPDIHEAVKFFVKEIGLAGYEKILMEKALSVLNNLKYSNLRSIRQSFVHIRYIFDILKDSLKKDSITGNYISRLVEYFLVLFIQKANGKINTENEFIKAIRIYNCYKQSLEVYNKNHRDEKDTDLLIYYGSDSVPLKDLYFNIIQKGDFSQKPILDDYQNCTAPHKPLTNLQYLTSQWYYLVDEDFKKYYNLVQQSFNNNEISNQEEIINWAELKFTFSFHELISESFDDIRESFLSYINTNRDNLVARNPDLPLGNPIKKEFSDSDLNIIKENLKRVNKTLWQKKTEKQFVDLYSGVSENITELEEFISDKFLDVPILTLTDVNKFYQKIKELDYSSQLSIYSALKTRYEKQECLSDIDKIKEIAELYEKDTGDIIMSPENFRKKVIAKNYKNLYESMEKLKEGSDKTT